MTVFSTYGLGEFMTHEKLPKEPKEYKYHKKCKVCGAWFDTNVKRKYTCSSECSIIRMEAGPVRRREMGWL